MTYEGPRVAAVSGGSRGIGRATVLRLARDGLDVSFCYRSDEDAAVAVAEEAEKHGVRALAVRADVADAAAVRDWIARTEDEVGPIAVAVAAAGIVRDNPLVLMSEEDWRSVLETNLGGVFHMCKAAVFPMMKRRTGRVVTVASVSGVYGNAGQCNYSAAKAGIIGFSKALAKEVARYGIQVNAVAPGYIDTDMVAGLAAKAREKTLATVAAGRMGSADEVADVVGFLAGAAPSYITGSVVQVDGAIAI
jgi:3-oxoacyl-[acyl-carrier protein] reductase